MRGDGGVLLPGNHEGLMLEAFDRLDARDVGTASSGGWHGFADPINAWVSNGGGVVLREVDPDGMLPPVEAVRRVRAALPAGLEAHLRASKSHHRTGDILIVHAGLHPKAPRPRGMASPAAHARRGQCRASASRPLGVDPGDFQRRSHGWDRRGARAAIHGHTAPWSRSFADVSEVAVHLDRLTTVGRICVDGRSWRNGTVAAVEMREGRYRLLAAVG